MPDEIYIDPCEFVENNSVDDCLDATLDNFEDDDIDGGEVM